MFIRYIQFLIVAFLVSACADHSFKDEQEFTSYVSQLELSALSLPSAISKVTTEGFTCYPQKNALHYCVREVKGLVCKQKQIIGLSSAETIQNSLKVFTKFGLVCL